MKGDESNMINNVYVYLSHILQPNNFFIRIKSFPEYSLINNSSCKSILQNQIETH